MDCNPSPQGDDWEAALGPPDCRTLCSAATICSLKPSCRERDQGWTQHPTLLPATQTSDNINKKRTLKRDLHMVRNNGQVTALMVLSPCGSYIYCSFHSQKQPHCLTCALKISVEGPASSASAPSPAISTSSSASAWAFSTCY